MRMPDMIPNPWATYVPTLYQATSRTTSALADAPSSGTCFTSKAQTAKR